MATEQLSFEGEFFKAIAVDSGAVIRRYIELFGDDMTSAELIGAYRKLVDLEQATDEEECALLDLLVPLA